jgi:small subunit ribosomal protein S1
VDLGGFEGLIHISEMSWGRVNHPGDVIQPGDEVQVCVLDVNPQERKVQLSLKRLQPDPWREVEGRYAAGELVEGEVTNVVSFGAFVRLEEGVEGLIHISELAEGNFLHPRNVVREREWVTARILNIDPVNRRIGLSLRQANQAPARRDGHENATADSDIASSQAATPSW